MNTALQITTNVEAKRFIGNEEIEVLDDVKNRCFFSTTKERKEFEQVVCRLVGAANFETILEDDFETALNCALTILRNRGEEILRGHNH